MSEISQITEINETPEVFDETESMYSNFEAELDNKCEKYTSEGRTFS